MQALNRNRIENTTQYNTMDCNIWRLIYSYFFPSPVQQITSGRNELPIFSHHWVIPAQKIQRWWRSIRMYGRGISIGRTIIYIPKRRIQGYCSFIPLYKDFQENQEPFRFEYRYSQDEFYYIACKKTKTTDEKWSIILTRAFKFEFGMKTLYDSIEFDQVWEFFIFWFMNCYGLPKLFE